MDISLFRISRIFCRNMTLRYAVVPQTAAFLLPSALEKQFSESSLLGCAFFTAMGAIRNAADLRSGESLVIIGAGGVGQGIIQLAKHLGASPIIAAP